mmetsp:Transcript_58791/g.137285  ORF Transcript_58791/g.137285 Transcript_58791/m.137285 type:complete len:288 (+) Transcript_58791:60-923(+)
MPGKGLKHVRLPQFMHRHPQSEKETNKAEGVPLVQKPGLEAESPQHVEHSRSSDLEEGVVPDATSPGLQSVTTIMNLLWFAVDVATMLVAAVGMLSTLLSLEWVDCVEFLYLFVFGAALAILDSPFYCGFLKESRLQLGKYVHFLTMVFGKGLVFIFLGCALWASTWANVEGVVWLIIAAVAGFAVTLVGVFSLAISIAKSHNLNGAKGSLQDAGAIDSAYRHYAVSAPDRGLNQKEFGLWFRDLRGSSPSNGDLNLFFAALSSHPRREVISRRDIESWAHGRMVLL